MEKTAKRKYVPKDIQATVKRHRAQRRNFMLFTIAGACANLKTVAFKLGRTRDDIIFLENSLRLRVMEMYKTDPTIF